MRIDRPRKMPLKFDGGNEVGGMGDVFVPSSSSRKERQIWTFDSMPVRCQQWTGFVLLGYGLCRQKSRGV